MIRRHPWTTVIVVIVSVLVLTTVGGCLLYGLGTDEPATRGELIEGDR